MNSKVSGHDMAPLLTLPASPPPVFEEDVHPEQETYTWEYPEQPIEDLGRVECQGTESRRYLESEVQCPSAADDAPEVPPILSGFRG